MTDNDIDLYADDIDQDFAQVSRFYFKKVCLRVEYSQRLFTSGVMVAGLVSAIDYFSFLLLIIMQ